MRLELDISKKMRCGSEEFVLSSQFATSDRSLVLFGPSGSGKTLTLQSIAGLLEPDAGRIVVDGEVLFDSARGINLPARKRGVGYVFQDYALFPHLNVRDNVAFGLKPLLSKLRGKDARRVDELLDVFGLSRLAGLRPALLSGGQRQRTSLARALATNPRILLLDEPFSALDQPLRIRMRNELAQVLETINIPMVMVTHDSDEVETFAQSVVVYRNGGVVGMHNAADMAQSGRNMAETVCEDVAKAYDVQ